LATFFTIGHSNRTAAEFIVFLREAKAEIVADVRTIPKSRHNPQFNAEALAASLRETAIGYRPMPALGGLRGKSKDAGPSPNSYWENESFRNFADYTATATFRQGLEALLTLGRAHPCAIMCAEAVWWRCHRRIISDYLLAAGEEVIHILGEGNLEPAQLTEAAFTGPDGVITYPGAQGDLLLR
jgi:uncharacterized protein (DUF488 family)